MCCLDVECWLLVVVGCDELLFVVVRMVMVECCVLCLLLLDVCCLLSVCCSLMLCVVRVLGVACCCLLCVVHCALFVVCCLVCGVGCGLLLHVFVVRCRCSLCVAC